MSIALDASTPVRWSGTINNTGTITSAAFTAPTNAYLVLCVEADGDGTQLPTTFTVADSGGLTWTTRPERRGGEATAGGYAGIFTARTVSSVSRTVSVTRPGDGTSTLRVSAVAYVFTGVDVDGTPVDTVGANNEGGSATNNLSTTSLTPGATGVLVAAGTEYSAAGACTSSDLKGVDSIAGSSHAEYAGAIDVMDGWKVCTSGVGVTGNLDAAGAGAVQWKWVQLIVREAAAGGASVVPILMRQFRQRRHRALPTRPSRRDLLVALGKAA